MENTKPPFDINLNNTSRIAGPVVELVQKLLAVQNAEDDLAACVKRVSATFGSSAPAPLAAGGTTVIEGQKSTLQAKVLLAVASIGQFEFTARDLAHHMGETKRANTIYTYLTQFAENTRKTGVMRAATRGKFRYTRPARGN